MSRYPKRSNQTGQYTDEAFGGPEAVILFTDRWIFKYICGCQLFFGYLHSFEQLNQVVRGPDQVGFWPRSVGTNAGSID